MSISYEEALATLQSMFGETWSREDLDTVLRHKQGHMENTVDMILRHGEASPAALLDQIATGVDPAARAALADEALARQLAQGSSRGSTTTTARKGRGIPTILPDDFLRVPSANGGSPTTGQLDSDEALARMLQDQMFTDEVRNNPDLAHLARGRPRTVGGRPVGGGRGAAGRSAQPQQPEVDILKSLGDLGNNTKRRLQTLAAQFNAKMKAGQANANSGEPAAHGSERRGLLDGDDDGEEVALEFASRKDL